MSIKNIFSISWPFIVLISFFVWAYIYIRPLLPEDFMSFDKIKKVFQKEEAPINPDAKYKFNYSHEKLKPKTKEEILKIIEDAKKQIKIIKPNIKNQKELEDKIKNAKDGDEFHLASGKYFVNLEIDKNITITGQGSSTQLIAKDEKKALMKINSKNFVLKNLQIKDSSIGIEIKDSTSTIENVDFQKINKTAIYLENSYLNFYNSQIRESNSAIKTKNAKGKIKKSIIEKNNKSGIELRASDFEVKENIITENKSYGIFADELSRVIIEDNWIERNGGFEVRVEGEKEIYR